MSSSEEGKMPEIRKALVTVQLKPENMKKLLDALSGTEIVSCEPRDGETMKKICGDVDVAILNSDCPIPVSCFRKLKWMHCSHAGVEKTICPEFFERNIILTSARGRSAKALAEHSFAFMLALTYNFPEAFRRQERRLWSQQDMYPLKTGLYGKTLGIVGLGNTGLETARIARTFDMKTLGYRRGTQRPENIDEVFSSQRGDDLKAMLQRCDYVVLCIELNDETYHLIGEDELRAMKKSAILVNMGRGALIDETLLACALRDGWIHAAGLDTFETEPLPPQSPLWGLENVIITPHLTPSQPDKDEKMLEFILRNIEAYRKSGEFVNRITEKAMFTKRQLP